MPLSETVLVLTALLAVAVVVSGLGRDWPVPDTVLLVLVGLALGQVSQHWELLSALHGFRLSPEVVFSILLPALIFESGFNLDARQLVKNLEFVLVLAIPALLLSTALVGLGCWQLLGVEPITALLFGALISATDPVAVIALFRELGAPRRLHVLVEGEALLNDATAIVVFGILLGIALEGGAPSAATFVGALVSFARVFVGGAAVGAAIGVLAAEVLYRLRSGRSAILTMSMVVAYGSFILAEHVLHLSGVMASASGAVALAILGLARMPRGTAEVITETWEFVALVCNSLLFLLLGLSVDPLALSSRLGPVAIACGLVLAARAVTVHGLVPATTWLFSLPAVSAGERHIMWWGGLKGGLAIAIVLSIPDALPGRELLLDLTFGVVVFTMLVNAPTVRPLMRRLGMDRLDRDERAELRRSLDIATSRADREITRFGDSGLVSDSGLESARTSIRQTLAPAPEPEDGASGAREAYIAVLRSEFEELERLNELDVIDTYTYLDMRNRLQADRDSQTKSDAQPLAPTNPFHRLETLVLRRIREHDWATPLLARYQRRRAIQRLQHNIAGILMCEAAIETLHRRVDLEPAASKSMEKLYQSRLVRRRNRVATIRAELPELFERIESRMLSRVGLGSALRGAEEQFRHGEIGAKAFAEFERRVTAALSRLSSSTDHRAVATVDLLREVPLLAGLSDRALVALAARARPVTFLAGDVIIGEGERGNALYLLTAGNVGVSQRAANGRDLHVRELDEGAFFGELGLLGDHIRTATVTASTPTTLLRLTRRAVMALAAENPEVRRQLDDAQNSRIDHVPVHAS
jgi:CPA1 family monovalent cation:H+ antiporter